MAVDKNQLDAHDLVEKVTERLLDRYHQSVPRHLVEATTRDVVLDLTRDAAIPDFVPVLAERRVRERLGHCR